MKVDRLVSMIMILLEKRRVGAQELAAMFEVSPRTVYRDMEALNQAGIPVRSIPGVGGGFEIMPDYKADKRAFSADDLSALLMGLNNLSGMMQGDAFKHAMAKVRSFIPAEQAKAIELKASQVCIDPRPWMGGGHVAQHLDTIKEALQQSRRLSFVYTDGYGNRTDRTVEPYQLVLKSNHWYVHAFCRSRNDFRLFRLSRMSSLRMLDEVFAPRDCPKPVLESDDLPEPLQTDIRLRVHASVLDRILDFYPPERVTPDGAGHYLVDYPFIERDYDYDMLLSFGDKCECLAPDRVRDELRRRIKRMARIYGERGALMNTNAAPVPPRNAVATYHLPGLFEFTDLYRAFLPLYRAHREWFYDWCEIGSIYGAPADCIWGGGRIGAEACDPQAALALTREYGISARLTFSNSLLREEHLSDRKCNALCRLFEASGEPQNGVILHSELLLHYIQRMYPGLYLVSSTTKVLTDFGQLERELDREAFRFVVPDFRLNKALNRLGALPDPLKAKVEFLCNECCWFGCRDRKRCYEAVSRKILGESGPEHRCAAPNAGEGYRFSRAMENPGFIGIGDIVHTYLPMGFTQFKIEGRGLGGALILEFLLYYMTRPEHQLKVREKIYLSNALDLF